MAASISGEKWTAQFEYKSTYDTAGLYDLADYTKTISTVKETATLDQIFAANAALLSITVYKDAPYRQYLTKKGQLVNL